MIDCRRPVFGYLYILMAVVCLAAVLPGRAAASPVFVMLEYADETIYKDIDSAEIMSSIVLEKMVCFCRRAIQPRRSTADWRYPGSAR